MSAFILFAVLLLAPLPLASNRPLFEGLIALAAGTALLHWGWRGQLQLGWRRLAPIWLCFGLFWLWALISLFWSVDFSASLIGLMRFTAYFGLAAVALQLARDIHISRQLLKALAFSSAFYAAYGLAVYALGNDHILWFEKWAYTDSLTATFVNRNAFAAYAGMGLLACLALLANNISREQGNWRAILRSASTTFWLAGAGATVLCLALVLSNSRAGIISILMGLLAFWAGLWFSRMLPRQALAVIGILGCLLIAGSILAVGPRLLQRSDGTSLMQDDRPQIWRASMHMIADKPFTGWGVNTYDQMFLQYRTPAIRQNYTKAHSTYLEMAATTGLPATMVFLAGFAFSGIFLLRGIHIRRQNRIYPVLGFAVLTQAGFHALVDFSFQTPANAAILAITLGACVAQSFSSEQA